MAKAQSLLQVKNITFLTSQLINFLTIIVCLYNTQVGREGEEYLNYTH